jgi:indole-3-glycerol phosphate synthase
MDVASSRVPNIDRKYLRRKPEVQASRQWTPPQGALGTLVQASRERARLIRTADLPGTSLRRRARAFSRALTSDTAVALIAEIKRSSPSRGAIAPGLSAGDQARLYASAGADAISVLTEPEKFGGSLDDLDSAGAAGVPLLRKDFIVDPLQLREAVAHGAAAALLIARALPPTALADLFAYAAELGLESLVEVHDEEELSVALSAGYPIIGVNNRNLETLEVDDGVTARLIPQIPRTSIAIYESGIRDRSGVERAAAMGADAVLVGTALSASADVVASVRALTGVARHARSAA